MPVAHELKAIGAEGFTVEALGGPERSPGKRVTKPPLAAGWTTVTWARIPLRSAGKNSAAPNPAPNVRPATRKRLMVFAASAPGPDGTPTAEPSALKPIGPPASPRVSRTRVGAIKRSAPRLSVLLGA